MSQATEAGPATPRPAALPPVVDEGALGWIRKNLFSSWGNAITTVLLVAFIVWLGSFLLNWAVLKATFSAESGKECVGTGGACWAIIETHIRQPMYEFGPFSSARP